MVLAARRATVLAISLSTIALAALPARAPAYELLGHRWSTSTITYRVTAARYVPAVERAARAWNRAGVGVRFRRTSGVEADVVIRYGGAPCDGLAEIAYRRSSPVAVWLGRGCATRLITLTAVHELGHVLGLDHETRACARMNPSADREGTPDRCGRRTLAAWLARPLTADDLRGARALFEEP
jgi:predicted Zn-dependent protease